jgi:DNA-binding transcriptional MerR regulator
MSRNVIRKVARTDAAPSPGEDELYGITELAQECGISLRTIRFYEDKGLLAPRRINGGRAYTRRDRVRLGLILRGKAVGMSLAEIEHILSLYGDRGEGHVQQLEYLIGRIEAAMAELDTRQRHIAAMLGDLGDVRGQLKKALAAKRRVRKPSAN